MKLSKTKRFIAVALIISGLPACNNGPTLDKNAAELPACGWFPNCVNSESGEGSQAIEPVRASQQHWQQLKQWLGRQDHWQLIEVYPNLIQAVVKTPLLGFTDDVVFRFDAASELIHVRSSSRLGLSDLGANRKRIETIRKLIAAWGH